jgi:hypothetical protein
MKAFAHIATAALLASGLSSPLAAQDQTYSQGDATAQRVIGGVIDALIGNRYNVSDRQAIRSCTFAAVQQAENQYRPFFRGSNFAYPGWNGFVRVTAITDVQRRAQGVRVRGLLDTARFGYVGGRRGSDAAFRCDVDRRGRVFDVRVDRNPYWRR